MKVDKSHIKRPSQNLLQDSMHQCTKVNSNKLNTRRRKPSRRWRIQWLTRRCSTKRCYQNSKRLCRQTVAL